MGVDYGRLENRQLLKRGTVFDICTGVGDIVDMQNRAHSTRIGSKHSGPGWDLGDPPW